MTAVGTAPHPPEIDILMGMWRLKAVGERRVSQDELLRRLFPLRYIESDKYVHNLTERRLVESTDVAGSKLISLTPLGVALVRQLQEKELEDLVGGSWQPAKI